MYSIPLFLLTKEMKEPNIFSQSDIQNHQNFCKLFSKVQASFERKMVDPKSQKTNQNCQKDKDLPNKVWSWYDNLSLEEKLQICTIKNQWALRLLIQLSFINYLGDQTTFEHTNEMNSLFSNGQNLTILCNDINLFNNKKDQKISIGYIKDDYYNLYFKMKKHEFNNRKRSDTLKEEKQYENILINNIVLLSIEKEDSLDSFTLREELLKDSKTLKQILNYFSNKECFKEWILPTDYNNFHNFIYPIWMHFKSDLSFCQIICGFFEQQILVAYEYFFYTKKIYLFPKDDTILEIYKENLNLENYLLNKKNREKIMTLELINEMINDIKVNINFKKKISNYKKMFDQICTEYYNTEFYIGNKIWDNQGEIIYRELIEEIKDKQENKIHLLLNKITFISLNDVRNFREFIYYKLKKYFTEMRNKEIIDELLNNTSENKETKKKKKKKKKNKNHNSNNNDNNININININKTEENNKNIIINEKNTEKNFSSNDEKEEDNKSKENISIKEQKTKNKEFFLFPINNKKNKNKIKNSGNNSTVIKNEKSLSEKNNIQLNYKETKEDNFPKIENENKIIISNKSKSKTDMTQLSETSIIHFEMINKKENNKIDLNSPESTT